ncbi:MAG: transporter substrate-binding domain-containing protein [Proteobacteria bacterium]|nr:transporter substrate-binding domain-containing protein [Pseudomonadota bacterium]
MHAATRWKFSYVLRAGTALLAGTLACAAAAATPAAVAGAPHAAASASQPAATPPPGPEAGTASHAVHLVPGLRPWTGDLDGMEKRRIIRALVPYSKTFYYVEKGRARGISYDVFKAFEDDLNRTLKSKTLKVHVVFLPVARNELIPKLNAGLGDVVFADLTVTPERQKVVDFSAPLYSGIQEVVVTGPGAEPVANVETLSGRKVYVRPSSSYHEHLVELNARLAAAGKAPVTIVPLPEELETEDVLEMVNAGLIPITVVDRYKALMWRRVFTAIRFDNAAIVHDGGDNGFLLRKDSPQFKAALDAFVATHRQGTAFGNTVVNRYVRDPRFVKNALGDDEQRRFGQVIDLFRTYGDRYDMDYLLMVAQGFQESQLDQGAKSHVGAIGVMQIMPQTGKDLGVGDIHVLDNNVNGGIKYMRWMIDHYFANEPMTPLNKALFAFAAYNAGPARVASLRREAVRRGLDPNRWFNNVELVAADKIGPETVTYVSNIYKYYTAYQLLVQQDAQLRKVKATMREGAGAPSK